MSRRRNFLKSFLRAKNSPQRVRHAFMLVRALHIAVFLFFVGSLLSGSRSDSFFVIAVFSLGLAMASQIFVVNVIGHRFIGHRNFSPSRGAQFFLLAWSVIVGLSSPLSSSLLHRRHHASPDTDNDPHSPPTSGSFKDHARFFARIYFNFFDEKNFSFREVLRESRRPFFLFFHRNGADLSLIVSVVLFFSIGLHAVFFFQTIPVLTCFIGQFNLVYQTHVENPNSPGEKHSVDSALANFLTLGEGAHASHHAAPGRVFYPSERLSLFDLTGFVIRAIWVRK